MKKKELINLIKAYTYRNDTLFKKVCYEIADEFYSSNNKDLADYIISLISNDYFLPQNDDISSNFEEENNHNIINKPFFSSNKGSLLNDDEFLGNYLTKYSYNEKEPLFLPSDIKDDYIGVINAIKRNNAIYFGAIGGAGALISKCIKSSEVIAYDDLGAEAIRKLEVKDMPLVVIIDTEGNNLYEIGKKEYLESI